MHCRTYLASRGIFALLGLTLVKACSVVDSMMRGVIWSAECGVKCVVSERAESWFLRVWRALDVRNDAWEVARRKLKCPGWCKLGVQLSDKSGCRF